MEYVAGPLPLRAAFPILVDNLLSYLLPGGFENQSFALGQPVTLAAVASCKAVTAAPSSSAARRSTWAGSPPPCFSATSART